MGCEVLYTYQCDKILLLKAPNVQKNFKYVAVWSGSVTQLSNTKRWTYEIHPGLFGSPRWKKVTKISKKIFHPGESFSSGL